MAALTMKELLEAGGHFGHQTKRWNPKMQKYIFGERNGIYIIDLQKTLKKFREAYGFVRELAAGGGSLLCIGTRKRAQATGREEAIGAVRSIRSGTADAVNEGGGTRGKDESAAETGDGDDDKEMAAAEAEVS